MRSSHVKTQSVTLNTDNNIIEPHKPSSLPEVFYSFLSEENIREVTIPNQKESTKKQVGLISLKHKSEFLSNFRTKKHAIKSMFKIKNSIFDMIKSTKPPALKRLEKGMKKYFFGPDGIVANELLWFKRIFRKRRQFTVGLDTKIYAGNLAFLDLKNKNSYNNRLDEAKKMYLKRSQHFTICDKENDKPLVYQSFKKETITTPPNLLRLVTSPKKNRKTSSMMKCEKTKTSPRVLHKRKKPFDCTIYNTYFPSNSYKKSRNRSNVSLTLPARPFSTCTISRKKELTSKIQLIDTNYNELENKLFQIIDQSNTVRGKTVNVKEEKIKEDVEVILDAKMKKKTKQKTKDLLKEAMNNKELECKKAIMKLSDGITRMNNETALNFAEQITEEYYRKTRNGQFYIPKKRIYSKYNFNQTLRKKCNGNYKVMEKMAFSLDKLKQRYKL